MFTRKLRGSPFTVGETFAAAVGVGLTPGPVWWLLFSLVAALLMARPLSYFAQGRGEAMATNDRGTPSARC